MEFMQARQALEKALESFAPTREHLVPDLIVLNYLHEIDESTMIVDALSHTTFPHRAYPSARAASEAAQYLLLVVTDTDYDLAGAQAWLYHLGKDRDFSLMHTPEVTDFPVPPADWYAAAAAEIGATWEETFPGKGAVVPKAVEKLKTKSKKPDNWAGVNPAAVLPDRIGTTSYRSPDGRTIPGRDVFTRAYAVLNRGTHPGTRLRPTNIASMEDGTVRFTFEEHNIDADRQDVRRCAAAALNFATLALQIRQRIVAT